MTIHNLLARRDGLSALYRKVFAINQQLSLFNLETLTDSSVVYFAERRGYIKIGTTMNLNRRMRQVRARPLLVLPGDVTVERDLHRRFAGSRMVGEWFAPTPELWDFIHNRQQVTAA